MKIAKLAARRTALRATVGSIASPLSVDADAGVIRGAAVACIGPAAGHGFELDRTTLEKLAELGNAAGPDGVKSHLSHPEAKPDGTLSDQVGAIIGRCQNFRLDGDTLRCDLAIGDYAANMPGLGNVRGYLLGIAQDDPAAIGLSAVMEFDVEDIADGSGMPMGLVARPTDLYQIDLVGQGAATPRGLLAAAVTVDDGADPVTQADPASPAPASSPIKSAMAVVIAKGRDLLEKLRAIVDAYAADDSQTALDVFEAALPSTKMMLDACRGCIDQCNAVRAGSVMDEATTTTAIAIGRSMEVISDEITDVRAILAPLRYGASPFSYSAEILLNVLESVESVCGDLLRAARIVANWTAFMAMHRRADELLRDTDPPELRRLTMRAVGLLEKKSDKAAQAMAELASRYPDQAARVRLLYPQAFQTPASRESKELKHVAAMFIAGRLRGVKFLDDGASGLKVEGGDPVSDHPKVWDPFLPMVQFHLQRIAKLELKFAAESDPERQEAIARCILLLDPCHPEAPRQTEPALLLRGLRAMGFNVTLKPDGALDIAGDPDVETLVDDALMARIKNNLPQIVNLVS